MIPPFHGESVMMKRKICLMGALLITILACGLSPQKNIFETDTFGFSIPDDWLWGAGDIQVFGSAFQQIVGIRNPQGLFPSANFTILTSPLNDAENFETRVIQTYAKNDNFGEVAKQGVEVDGYTGYEIIYTHNAGEALFWYRDIWLEKDRVIYVLSFSCLKNSKDNYTSIFDQILDSFSFKD
jgi:hypothetical protein